MRSGLQLTGISCEQMDLPSRTRCCGRFCRLGAVEVAGGLRNTRANRHLIQKKSKVKKGSNPTDKKDIQVHHTSACIVPGPTFVSCVVEALACSALDPIRSTCKRLQERFVTIFFIRVSEQDIEKSTTEYTT